MTTSATGPRRTLVAPTRDSVRAAQVTRHMGIVGLAGGITGVVVGGIDGRIFMRLAAVFAGDQPVGALTETPA